MTARRVGIACAVALGIVQAGHWQRQRRRALALTPKGVATSAGITMFRSRRAATLRSRAVLPTTDRYPAGSDAE